MDKLEEPEVGDVEMYKVEYETEGRKTAAFQSREDILQAVIRHLRKSQPCIRFN